MTFAPNALAPVSNEQLLSIPLAHLHERADNPNVMTEEMLEKLARNIEREGFYPPIIVRAHPVIEGEYEILDGAQRTFALARCGVEEARCFVWACTDETALLLLLSLNRIHGEDKPVLRAAVLKELNELLPLDVVASLLPESPREIERTLALVGVDASTLLADLTAATERSRDDAVRTVSFVVPSEEIATVLTTISGVAATIDGRNKRGRALAVICKSYAERADA